MCDEAALAAFASVTGLMVLLFTGPDLLSGLVADCKGCGVGFGGGVETPLIALMPRVLLAQGAQRFAAWIVALTDRRGVVCIIRANAYRIANAAVVFRAGPRRV